MTNELIDMHNRITTEELDRLVRHQLKQIFDHSEQAEMLPPVMTVSPWMAAGLRSAWTRILPPVCSSFPAQTTATLSLSVWPRSSPPVTRMVQSGA